MSVCVCVCLSVCLFVRRRSQSLNQSTDLVQIRYLGSSCEYLQPFFQFSPTPKIKGSSHEKKNLIFSKMAPTILIKFCRFIVHSKPNNMILANLPGKIPETGKIYFKFFPCRKAGPKPNYQSRSKSISRVLSQISRTLFFSFHTNPKIRVVHIRKELKILIFSKMAPTILIKF